MSNVNGGLPGSGGTGFLGSMGNALGTNSGFVAQQAPNADANWNGPSQAQLGQGTSQYLGQAGQLGSQVQTADRGAQNQYLNQLANFGSGTSAAQGMLQAGTNAANASAQSLARGSGGNPAQQAAALRQAQAQQATNITGASNNAAQLQAQQQATALGMQGNALQGMTSTDLQQQQLAAQLGQNYLGAQIGVGGQQLQSQEANNALNSNNFNTAQGINAGISQGNAAANGQLLGAVTNGAGSVLKAGAGALALSDARAKKDVEEASHGNAADAFLSTLKPYTYQYKDASDEPTDAPHGGHYLGIMAQNAERGPTGDTIVQETPRGKALQGPALLSALAAGAGRLHERVSQLEAEKKGMQR